MSSHFRSPSGRRPFRPFRTFRSNRGYRGRGVGRGGINIRENFDNNHYSDKFDSRYKNYKIHRGSWYGKERIVLSPDGHSLSSRHSRDRFSDNRSHDYSFHRKYREDSSSHRSRGSSYHVHPKERERFGFRSENDFRRKPENLREFSEYDSELISSSYTSGTLSRGIRRKPRGVGLRRITTTNHILMRKNYLRTERNKKLSVLALRKMKMIKMLRMKNAARGLYGKRQSSKASDKSAESTRNSAEIEDRARNDVNESKNESLNKSLENDGEKENFDKKSGEKEKERNSKDIKKMKKIKHENEINNSEELEEDKEMKTEEDREASDDKVSNSKMNTNMFIELKCPHCKKSYRTFMQYRNHLQSFQHKSVMVKLVHMLKRKLGLLRFDQRKAQQTIDKHADSQRVFFCDLCKLRYKQSKADHNMSYFHLTITEFLLPRCKLCKINFQTPIGYEHHRCSLLHIKRKAAFKDGVKSKREAVEEEVEEEADEFNEPFILVDQVESGEESDSADVRNDGDEEHSKMEDVKSVKEKNDKTDESHTDKEELGMNFLRIIKTAYCDLCGTCVPYQQNKSVRSLMRSHCRRSVHIKNYNRYKEQKSSDKAAEESKQITNELDEDAQEDDKMTVEPGEVSADERYKYSDDEGDIVKKRFDRLHSTNEG